MKYSRNLIDHRKYLNNYHTNVFREVEKTRQLRENQRRLEESAKLLKEKDETIAKLQAQLAAKGSE
jgi:hypothetical protein